jgi:hypothetical protein
MNMSYTHHAVAHAEHLTEEELLSFAFDEASAELHARVQAHVEGCITCAAELEGFLEEEVDTAGWEARHAALLADFEEQLHSVSPVVQLAARAEQKTGVEVRYAAGAGRDQPLFEGPVGIGPNITVTGWEWGDGRWVLRFRRIGGSARGVRVVLRDSSHWQRFVEFVKQSPGEAGAELVILASERPAQLSASNLSFVINAEDGDEQS